MPADCKHARRPHIPEGASADWHGHPAHVDWRAPVATVNREMRPIPERKLRGVRSGRDAGPMRLKSGANATSFRRSHPARRLRPAGRRRPSGSAMLHYHPFFADRRSSPRPQQKTGPEVVRLDGIEPTTPAWKAEVLPLNYSRLRNFEASPPSPAVKPSFQGTAPMGLSRSGAQAPDKPETPGGAREIGVA